MKNKRILLYLNKLTERKIRLELDLELILNDVSLEFKTFEKKINKTFKELNKIDYKIKSIEHYIILNPEENE